MITAVSADGTAVAASDEGDGPVVLVLHPGLDDGRSWAKVAARLARRFRVVRVHRRPYRLDLDTRRPVPISQEVEDVLAVARLVGPPALLVGHSSGGVVALEVLAADPGAFAGAVLYEPPVIIGPPLGGEATRRAQAAIARGRPGAAMTIFLQDVVRIPAWVARLSGAFVAAYPRYRAMVPGQINELAAIDELGVRLDVYARIDVPTTLVGGDRSPSHLGERLDALARTLPNSNTIVMRGQGHDANLKAPHKLANIIEAHADAVLN